MRWNKPENFLSYIDRTIFRRELIHGAKIISKSLLPVGEMFEEVQETCKKILKTTVKIFPKKLVKG